jgi:hypothetical protein
MESFDNEYLMQRIAWLMYVYDHFAQHSVLIDGIKLDYKVTKYADIAMEKMI